MAIYGYSFEYDGKSSEDFGVTMCTSGPIDNVPLGLTREAIKGENTNHRPVANFYGIKYSDVLSFEITITKLNDGVFSRNEVREINTWLTSPRSPSVLSINDDEFDLVDYYGLFTGVENTYASGIAMLTYTFQTNAPDAWSKIQKFDFECTGDTEVKCINDTDEIYDYVYPDLTITSTSGSEISIINKSELSMDEKKMSFTFPDGITTIYIDTKFHKVYYIVGGKQIMLTFDQLGINTEEIDKSGILSLYWLRLVPGKNVINIKGNCTLTISYRSPRKVGAY